MDLRWLGRGNGAGIGAQLILQTDQGDYRRDVTALSGYLSGDSSRIHFGFPAEASLQRLSIRWHDGEYSEIEDMQANMLITVTRD